MPLRRTSARRTHQRVIYHLMRRPSARARTWAHLKDNWDTVVRKFGIFQGILGVVGSLQHLCDADARTDVNRFFGMHPVSGTDRTLQQSLETIQRCTSTKSAQGKNLAAFPAPNP